MTATRFATRLNSFASRPQAEWPDLTGKPSLLQMAARAAICSSDGLPVRSGHSACGREAKEFRRVAKRVAVMVDPSIVMTSHKYKYL